MTPHGDEPGLRYEQWAHATSGGSVFQARGDIIFLPQVPAPPAAMRTLPLDVAGFTGRETELALLLAPAGPANAVVIHAVDGMAGVGKTALVRRAAHLLADRFSDGQLFVDLHAHTPGQIPADPAAVLAWLLDKTGMDPRHIPADLDGRAARWRDRIAGRKVLLILDDAATSAQVRPLLPGSGVSLVLITSRRRLVDLEGAVPLSLATLPPDQARMLFLRVSGRISGSDQDDAVAHIVQLCGYLPLAIILAARRLIHRSSWSVTDLAADFAAASDRLAELTGGDRPGDLAVATAFDMSYHDLPLGQQELFRRLGLHPGIEVDAYAAAALDAISLTRARRSLDALYLDHLLDETVPGRYRLHDLLRSYAHALTSHDPANGRIAAVERLLSYYEQTASSADQHLARYNRPARASAVTQIQAIPDLSDRAAAMSWMRAEHANLLACTGHASAQDLNSHITALTAAFAEFLRLEGPWSQATTLHRAAVTAARQANDCLGEAGALHDLGITHSLTGDFPAAADILEQARAIYQRLGSQLGEASTLNELGHVSYRTGDYPTAASLLHQALAIYQQLGDRLGEAYALNELGIVRCLTDDYPAAAGLLEQAQAIYQDLGDRLGEANTLNDLGRVRYLTDDYPAAAGLLEQAQAIFQQLGDHLGEANALGQLSLVRYQTDDYPAATSLLERAQAIFKQLGNRVGEANTLNDLGHIYYETGDCLAAARLKETALTLYRQLGDRLGEASTLNDLGHIRHRTGDFSSAADLLERAQAIFQQVGSRIGEAYAVSELGRVRNATGDYSAAVRLLERAQAIFQQLGNRDGEAGILHELGRVRYRTGDYAAAASLLKQALAMFQELSDRHGEAETLNSLATLTAESADPHQALPMYEQALHIARRIHSPLDEAHALEGIARCTGRIGDLTTATTNLQAAVTIYQRISAFEAESAATYLVTLENSGREEHDESAAT